MERELIYMADWQSKNNYGNLVFIKKYEKIKVK